MMSYSKIGTIIIVILFIVSCITAWSSTGFYHADEHYQLVEFAGFKLGTNSETELAWEFNSKMRPTFQVGVAYMIFKCCEFGNLSDPYVKTFLLRYLTLLMTWASVVFFVKKLSEYYNFTRQSTISLLLLTLGLWFIPFLSVRFSSESWSGIFLIVVLALVFKKKKNLTTFFLMGFLAGISFLCRYQIAFAIIPIFIYLIPKFVDKKGNLLSWLSGFCFAIIGGIAIDYWFYGSWVITAWNYFYINIVENVAANFGVEGPLYYLDVMLNHPTLPLGIALFSAIFLLLIKQPKNLLIWIVICFVLGHSLIGHKEERFLFPLALLFGPILFLGFRDLLCKLKMNKTLNLIFRFALGLFISGNIFGLIVMFSSSAGIGRMELTKYLHQKSKEVEHIKLYSTKWSNPYNPWSIPMKFYQESNIKEINIHDMSLLNEVDVNHDHTTEVYFVIRKNDKEDKQLMEFLRYYHFTFVKQSVPKWLLPINYKHGDLSMRDVLSLYKHQP
jgi:phosphatidylinositol glycan class B